MAFKYKQGYFTPQNKEKYVGDNKTIYYRSSWELKFMKWCDKTPSVLKWNSEETIIPYISPVDNKAHRYFLDFKIQLKTNSGEIKIYLVEIKPEAQTVKPKKGNKKEARFINEAMTWMVNEAKWNAAKLYAKQKGYEFIILTERHLL